MHSVSCKAEVLHRPAQPCMHVSLSPSSRVACCRRPCMLPARPSHLWACCRYNLHHMGQTARCSRSSCGCRCSSALRGAAGARNLLLGTNRGGLPAQVRMAHADVQHGRLSSTDAQQQLRSRLERRLGCSGRSCTCCSWASLGRICVCCRGLPRPGDDGRCRCAAACVLVLCKAPCFQRLDQAQRLPLRVLQVRCRHARGRARTLDQHARALAALARVPVALRRPAGPALPHRPLLTPVILL